MQNIFLQLGAGDGDSAIEGGIWNLVDKINPLQMPHDTFVTDLAVIMILAGIVTLAFFKIKQPLIIGYLFAGMLIGPLSPLWTSFLPETGTAESTGTVGILSDIAALRKAGCVAISDDGYPVADALLMRRALEYADMFQMPVIDHCDDLSLKGDGVAHEGFHASALGLRGLPAVAEELMVERDITLAGLTGGAVHIAHLSARGSLRAVKSGKQRKIRVTCEVAPHHFTLTHEALAGYDTNFKMSPPLRETADCDAILEGLADGSVDAIATDHAPHHYDEKALEFDAAPGF